MAKKIISVVVAALAAFVVIYAVEALGHAVYPPPAGVDWKNPEAIRAYVAGLPLGAFGFVLLAYAVGSLVGGALATLISGRASVVPGLVVGGLLMVAGVANLSVVPHPLWFAIVSTLLYLPLAWLGSSALIRSAGSL